MSIKRFIKDNYKIILALSVLNISLFFYSFFYYGVDRHGHGRFIFFYALMHLVLESSELAIYYFCKKRSFPLEKVFVYVFSPLVMVHLLVTPLNQIPDEAGHIYRAVAISEGEIIAPTNEKGEHVLSIDKTTNAVLYNWKNDHKTYNRSFGNAIKNASGDTIEANYDNTSGYHPVNYLPQTVGIWIGRSLRLPAGITLYMGRLAAALVFILLCYFALKLMPCYKNILFFFMMLPEVLQQGMSYSPDSLLFGLSFFVIAFAMKGIYGGKKRLGGAGAAVVFTTTLALALTKKIVYLPLFLLYCLIPKDKFGGRWKKVVLLSISLLVAIILSFAWSSTQDTISATTDNMQALLNNPLRFLVVAIGSLFGLNTSAIVEGGMGAKLGYNSVDALAKIYVYLAVVVFVLLVASAKEKIQQKKIEKAVYFAIPVLITGLLYVGAFTQWDFNRSDGVVIAGVQGRYLIPFLGLLPFLCDYDAGRVKKRGELISLDSLAIFGVFMNVCIIGCKFFYNI